MSIETSVSTTPQRASKRDIFKANLDQLTYAVINKQPDEFTDDFGNILQTYRMPFRDVIHKLTPEGYLMERRVVTYMTLRKFLRKHTPPHLRVGVLLITLGGVAAVGTTEAISLGETLFEDQPSSTHMPCDVALQGLCLTQIGNDYFPSK